MKFSDVNYTYDVNYVCLCEIAWFSCLTFFYYNNQVQQVKPDVLLGLSAVGGLFSKEVHNEYK